jgi:hypothetical protein
MSKFLKYYSITNCIIAISLYFHITMSNISNIIQNPKPFNHGYDMDTEFILFITDLITGYSSPYWELFLVDFPLIFVIISLYKESVNIGVLWVNNIILTLILIVFLFFLIPS